MTAANTGSATGTMATDCTYCYWTAGLARRALPARPFVHDLALMQQHLAEAHPDLCAHMPGINCCGTCECDK